MSKRRSVQSSLLGCSKRVGSVAQGAAVSALALAVGACGSGDEELAEPSVSIESAATEAASPIELATPGGWAGEAGGTAGGAQAAATDIYTVANRTEILAAIATSKNRPKIIRVQGTIDMSDGTPFASHDDQGNRGEIKLKPNTTIVGIGKDAGLVNGWFMIRKIDNVIVRNLKIINPCDVAPKFDSHDGATGNWNSEWDGLTIDGATHVWVDHVTFTDGELTDDKLPVERGHIKQCHDGALDIKNASDFVTISNNVFALHAKNNLIGQSDKNAKDEGHLTITFSGNLFSDIGQRAPRVRFAKLHSYNNYFVGSKTHPIYPHAYSLGAGANAKIISQNNAFKIGGASTCGDVIRNPNQSAAAGAVLESGSTLNDAPIVASQCGLSSAVGWTVPYPFSLLGAAAVPASVLANAGAGKL